MIPLHSTELCSSISSPLSLITLIRGLGGRVWLGNMRLDCKILGLGGGGVGVMGVAGLDSVGV